MTEPARKQMRLVMPESLMERLDRRSEGNRTRFVLKAVEERLDRLEAEELEADLAEGYRLRAAEHARWASDAAHVVAETVLGS